MHVVNLGEYGFSLIVTQTKSLSGAAITFFATKPDGTTAEWVATIDGLSYYYTFAKGDLDQIGTWVVWANALWSSPAKSLWARLYFKVKDAPTELAISSSPSTSASASASASPSASSS